MGASAPTTLEHAEHEITLIPAWRAVHVDPATVLRTQ